MGSAEYHAYFYRFLSAVMVNLAEDAEQPGIPYGLQVVFPQLVTPTARRVLRPLVVSFSLVSTLQVSGIKELPGQPDGGRPGDVDGRAGVVGVVEPAGARPAGTRAAGACAAGDDSRCTTIVC